MTKPDRGRLSLLELLIAGRRRPVSETRTLAERACLLRAAVAERTELTDGRILNAIEQVQRDVFVPEPQRRHAYDDVALPIGLEQTISQPSMVALMLAELDCQPQHEVLEVGSGSGYAAALLSQLVTAVSGIERHEQLVHRSRAALERLKVNNVVIHHGDGSRLIRGRQFERILVSAAAPAVPRSLLSALAPGGRLVMPLGPPGQQILTRIDLGPDGIAREHRSTRCLFVPLIEDDRRPNAAPVLGL